MYSVDFQITWYKEVMAIWINKINKINKYLIN